MTKYELGVPFLSLLLLIAILSFCGVCYHLDKGEEMVNLIVFFILRNVP